MRIALTGNPNSGKTTMFNALTGSNEKVGNWAGVTVDKKESAIKKSFCSCDECFIAVDLPGAYSMSPFTSEESVTSDYVKNSNPDAIINIVDATNLSRSLFFTTQLLELGIPVVVALNKSDINEKKNTDIDAAKLSEKLGCPVVNTSAASAEGLSEVIDAVCASIGKTQTAPYSDSGVDMTDKASVQAADRKRFEFVNTIVKEVEHREVKTNQRHIGDTIDDILINKWLGIPIFAVVMFLVFQISQSWLGAWIAEGYEFENEEHRRALVNLTMIDYCNRIKTFAKKYLYEIYPEDSIPRIIHNEYDDDYETYEPIVFTYNNLELILAKMKTTNENGETVKQRLNIRSALRKLNEFKQLADTDIESNPNNYVQKANPFEHDGIFESNESIEETFRYYLQYHYKKKQFTGTQVSKIFNMLKLLWRRFYSDYENGKLPKELSDAIEKDDVVEDELVNVYTHIAELNAFLAMMRAQAPIDKAWKDLQVVLDVFAVFVNCAKSN